MSGGLPPVSAEGWPRVELSRAKRKRTNKGGLRKRRKRAKVYARDGHRCVLCGRAEKLTLDHIRPMAYGGTDAYPNLRTLCEPCNQRENAEFLRRARAAS